MTFFAVHISDGVLAPWGWGAAFVLAGIILAISLFRVDEDEIPRIALLTAAFFVASSIHVKVLGTSVHLLLNGLVGVILGRRAPLAISVGLVLQAVLLNHGGYSTLGVNMLILTLPALGASLLFRTLVGRKATINARRAFWAGTLVGLFTVLISAALTSAVLIVAGVENWRIVATFVFLAHVPIAFIEGGIVGFAAGYLARAKPQLLRRDLGGPG